MGNKIPLSGIIQKLEGGFSGGGRCNTASGDLAEIGGGGQKKTPSGNGAFIERNETT